MDRICPLLGLAGDRRSAVDGVDGGHRCHAEEPAASLEAATQAQLCLTASHERCERYLAYVSRTGARRPGRSAVGDGFVATRLILAPQPAWRGIAGRARGGRPTPVIAAGAGLLALGLGTAAVAANLAGRPVDDSASAVVESDRPSPTVTERPTPSPRPTATAVTASATVEPSTPPPASPTSAPATPEPTAVPAPPEPQTYVVAEGDSLAAIADRFGTTVAALQAANGIEDANSIVIGETLVIP